MKLKSILIVILIAFFLIASSDYTVYITPTGKKYHREFCSTIKGDKTAISIEDAKEQNYEACKVCDP